MKDIGSCHQTDRRITYISTNDQDIWLNRKFQCFSMSVECAIPLVYVTKGQKRAI